MVLSLKRWFLPATLVVFAALALVPPAQAAFRLRIENVTTGKGVVVTDDGTGDLANTTPGQITFNGSIDGFSVNVTTGLSKPALTAGYAAMDLNSVNVHKTGGKAANLRITLEDTDFTNGPDAGLQLKGAIGGTLKNGAKSITVQMWANPKNLVPDLGPDKSASGVLGVIGGPPAGSVAAFADTDPSAVNGTILKKGPGASTAFAASALAPFTKNGNYALFSQVTVVFGSGAGDVSFNADTLVNPAPAGLLLALSGLPALSVGCYLRRRRQVRV